MIFKNAAELFADIAHSHIGQKRKYTDDPYIIHPRNVAYLVKIAGGTPEMISAAYLHDVLEDVAPLMPELFGSAVILKKFGRKVFNMVDWLTDKTTHEDGNREVRKKIDRERIAQAPKDVKTIKLADLIDNSLTICEYDPGFAKIYLREKRLLVDLLKEGNRNLWYMANSILIRHGY